MKTERRLRADYEPAIGRQRGDWEQAIERLGGDWEPAIGTGRRLGAD